MRRASVSIASNIAEGYGRNSKNDFGRFLLIAIGSLYELQTQCTIAKEIGCIADEVHITFYKETNKLQAMLFKFKRSLSTSK